jgi:hypothetical protein
VGCAGRRVCVSRPDLIDSYGPRPATKYRAFRVLRWAGRYVSIGVEAHGPRAGEDFYGLVQGPASVLLLGDDQRSIAAAGEGLTLMHCDCVINPADSDSSRALTFAILVALSWLTAAY